MLDPSMLDIKNKPIHELRKLNIEVTREMEEFQMSLGTKPAIMRTLVEELQTQVLTLIEEVVRFFAQ